MGCKQSLSKEAQEQRDVVESNTDVQFCASDVIDLQSVLWNLLVVHEQGDHTRSPKELRDILEAIRAGTDECCYLPPTMDELAWRLVTDAEEREENLADMHYVHKFETEEQVLSLLLSGAANVKQAALEVLLMWYVTTADCENMADHLELSSHPEDSPEEESSAIGVPNPSATEEDDSVLGPSPSCVADATASSLQSFVWKGSPDLHTGNLSFASKHSRGDEGSGNLGGAGGSPTERLSVGATHLTPSSLPCNSPWTAVSGSVGVLDTGVGSVGASKGGSLVSPKLRNTSMGRSSRPHLRGNLPSKLHAVVERLCKPYNAKNLEHLALVLRGAMRTALRRYSTSGYDEEGMKQRSNDQKIAGSEWSRDKAAAIARCGSLSDIPNMGGGGLLVPQVAAYPLTIVLDLDETLVYARRGPLWVRPGVTDFLKTLKQLGCEVVCWTASNRSYAGGILSRLDPLGEYVSQCIYSHPRWAARRGGPQVKNLSLIGRELKSTLIIDNLPDSVVGNETNAIVVENYEGCELHDTTLATLVKVIREIIASGKDVPTFMSTPALYSSHLRLTERALHQGGTLPCLMLNSEPASFSLPM